MEIFKRALIMKEGTIIMDAGINEGRQEMVENHNLYATSDGFLRVKVAPTDGEWWAPPYEWNYVIEQDNIPEWFWYADNGTQNGYLKRLYSSLCDWWSAHVRYNEKIEEIDKGFYLLKDCEVEILRKNVHVILDNTAVSMMCGKAIVEKMINHSEILEMCDETAVWSKSDDSYIYNIFDYSVVYGLGAERAKKCFLSGGKMVELDEDEDGCYYVVNDIILFREILCSNCA